MAHQESSDSDDQLDYFDDVEGLIEVFEFDYDAIFNFSWRVMKNNWMVRSVFIFVVLIGYGGFVIFSMQEWDSVPPLVPLFLVGVALLHFVNFFLFEKRNLRDQIHAQHVCITHDGIRYAVDRHKTGCRFNFQEKGKVTKTVPFDKLTDCDIEEPAGAEGPICCLVDRVLYQVNVDTASSGGGGHELTLTGLKDPHAFKSKVWAMKRRDPMSTPHAHGGKLPAPSQLSMNDGGSELVPLLQTKNRLLEEQNILLKQIAANTSR